MAKDTKKDLEDAAHMLFQQDLELSNINQELDELLSMQEAVLSNLIDGLVIIDPNGFISNINPRACEMLDVAKENVIDKKFDQTTKKISNNMWLLLVDSAKGLKTNKKNTVELEFTNKDKTVVAEVTTVEINDRGEVRGTMKIIHDVTRERFIDKMKSEFISIASHQLRTPLTAIKWTFNLLLSKKLGSLNKRQVSIIKEGAGSNDRITKLVNDLLNVSQIEEGMFGYTFAKVNIISLINISLQDFMHLINKRKICLQKDFKEKKIFVKADLNFLRMVMQNLLDNAVKYNIDGGKISISAEIEKKEDQSFARIAVKNTGINILQEESEKVFSKFFRSREATRKATSGSGLGLYIVKNVVEKHGGTISFNSKLNEGSSFVFTIPLFKR